MIVNSDSVYIKRCITLARLGNGYVAPNPLVGAVLVFEDQIVGEGYHQQYGGPHAEVNCLLDAEMKYHAGRIGHGHSFSSILENSTIYVSLEPCSHFGKTPPCADLIIDKKIPRAVIGCRDPFALVNGKGIEKLQEAGIHVTTGVLEQECIDLNKRFFTFHQKQRPYIFLKWAQSTDRKISGPEGSRVSISNAYTNRLVHKWRSEEPGIMVGTTTALLDNPSLTTRLWTGSNPVRLVVDMHLRLPSTLRVFDGASKTIILNKVKQEQAGNIEYFKVDQDLPFIQSITNALYRLHVTSVLVEGGAALLQSFIDAQLWDEALMITNNNLFIGNGTSAPQLKKASLIESQVLGSDTISSYKPLFNPL